MNKAISIGLTIVSFSFFTIYFITTLVMHSEMQKIEAYHYATVHEIESSDFAQSVMDARIANTDYETQIVEKSVKEDMRIYEVITKKKLTIPLIGYEKEYVKSSIAR